jgi:hypothetical protein
MRGISGRRINTALVKFLDLRLMPFDVDQGICLHPQPFIPIYWLTEVTVEACCVVVLVMVVAGPLTVCVTHFVEYFVIVCAGAVDTDVIVVPGSLVVSIL